MTRGEVLTYEAQCERDDFTALFGLDGNCSCHVSPPCGSCTHPGNPLNQAEDDQAWMWDDMAALLDEMERAARAAVADAIAGAAAHHLAAMAQQSTPKEHAPCA